MAKTVTERVKFDSESSAMMELRFILVPKDHALADGPDLKERLCAVLVGNVERDDGREGHAIQSEPVNLKDLKISEEFFNELYHVACNRIEALGY